MNKIKITAYMLLCVVCLTGGCSGKDRMYLKAESRDISGQEEPGQKETGQKQTDQKQTDHKESGQKEAGPQSRADTDNDNSSGKDGDTCFVYVCGAVRHPGVFEVPAGSRIYEVLTLAGGLKKNASIAGINQARQIADGDMIEILTVKEWRRAGKETDVGQSPAASPQPDGGRVNINTATAAALMTLNGIGEAKAAGIIAWREENGPFASTEELMEVSGIGEGVYAQIKDQVTVTE